jgi:hypothetical protein
VCEVAELLAERIHAMNIEENGDKPMFLR